MLTSSVNPELNRLPLRFRDSGEKFGHNKLDKELKNVDIDRMSSSSSSQRSSSSRARTRSTGLGSMTSEAVIIPSSSSESPIQDPHAKIFELKRRLIFVKNEHQLILQGLQAEIEDLKRKNKDLQFQLVMQDFSSKLQMEPTSKSKQETNSNNNNNNATNNNTTNNNTNNSSSNSVATLRVLQTQSTAPELENLENNIKKLESDLHEARSRNLYLSELVESHKRKLQENEVRQAATVLFTRNGLHNQNLVRPLESATSSLESTPQNSPRSNHDSLIASQHTASYNDITRNNQKYNRDTAFTNRLQSATKENKSLPQSANQNRNFSSVPLHANGSNDKTRFNRDVTKHGNVAFNSIENDDDNGSIDLPITPEVSDETKEVNMKLEEAERIISQLQEENLRQRKEIYEIRQSVDRNSRMKFRGCNHPTNSKSSSQSRKSSISPHKPRDILMEESLRGRKSLSFSEQHLNRSSDSAISRTETEDYFPPLTQSLMSTKSRKRSSPAMLSELPPVPGSSGSESSSFAARQAPLNLIALGESNSLIHLPAMEKKLTAKKLPGLFEHYRFGRSQEYVVGTPSGSGPMRAPPGPLGALGSSSDSLQQKSGSNFKGNASKLKTAINSERFPKK